MSKRLSFLKRAALTRHKMAQKLFMIMEDKKSNLALAADVTSQEKLFELADQLGPEICILKTHVDILEDFTSDFGSEISKIAKKHNFLIFEDRKFADIGQTVHLQYTKGIYHIHEWADLVNAHILPGPGVIEGLKSANLLLLAQMSSSQNMLNDSYTKKAVELAETHKETVLGFICQKKLTELPGMIHMTPGVQLEPGKDSLGQRYRTITEVIGGDQSDLVIVGRDILQSESPSKRANLYRKIAWDTYVKSL